MKIFLIEDFVHLPPVLTTTVVHLRAANISANFQTNLIQPSCKIGLGETDPSQKPEVENIVALSLLKYKFLQKGMHLQLLA
jgi:hypothetical protein